LNLSIERRSILLIIENHSIIPYSERKISAKGPLPYSTLNPDTNSDSPSEKSRGARLHSATVEINHNRMIGKVMNPINILYITIEDTLKVLSTIRNLNNSNAKLISYLIDCLQDRIDPIIANLLLEDHPINIIAYTPTPISNRINKKERL
jgi:hypothetical protein